MADPVEVKVGDGQKYLPTCPTPSASVRTRLSGLRLNLGVMNFLMESKPV